MGVAPVVPDPLRDCPTVVFGGPLFPRCWVVGRGGAWNLLTPAFAFGAGGAILGCILGCAAAPAGALRFWLCQKMVRALDWTPGE